MRAHIACEICDPNLGILALFIFARGEAHMWYLQLLYKIIFHFVIYYRQGGIIMRNIFDDIDDYLFDRREHLAWLIVDCLWFVVLILIELFVMPFID